METDADDMLRRVVRNAGRLLSTKLLGTLFAVAALSFAGRGLGVHDFGVLMLIHAFALGANAVTGFQSWQTVVRYGTPAIVRGDRASAVDAVRLSFGLDLAGGFAGMAGAMALLPALAPRLGIPAALIPCAIAYCTVIPGMASATPTGVLRMLRRFDLMAVQQPTTSIVRAATTLAAWRMHAGLPGFMLAWYAGNIAGDGLNWILCIRQLAVHGMGAGLRPGLAGPASRLPGSWRFAWTTNLSTTISSGWGSIGNLILGATLGPAAAGIYKVAYSIVESAGRPADLMARSLYPEIMRQDPRTAAPWRLCLRAGAAAGAVGVVASLVTLIAGPHVIAAAFGPRYAAAEPLLRIMTMALALSMATFPVQSLLYMAGRAGASLAVEAVATGAYLATLYGLSRAFGVQGAAWAYVLGTALASLAMLATAVRAGRDLLGGGASDAHETRILPIDDRCAGDCAGSGKETGRRGGARRMKLMTGMQA